MEQAGRHGEQHFTAPDTVRDVIIGMSDGLTVPFALAAGVSGAVAATGIVVTAGLAEIAAGAISMGFGGYLAARGEAEHYETERRREQWETRERMADEEQEIVDIFSSYNISREESRLVVKALKKDPEIMVDFMMKFELGLEKPDPKRAVKSAATIAASYVAGGFIPLAPYILVPQSGFALLDSVVVTIAALFVFGYLKGRFLGNKPWFSAMQTMGIGGVAAGVAYFLAKLVT